MIHKGVARTFFLYAYSIASGTPKTGDAANIIVYKAEDMGPATQVTDTITEIDPTNMPGWYRFTTTLNGNSAAISAVSTTSGVAVTLAGVYLNTGALPAVNAGSNGGLPVIGSDPLTRLDVNISTRLANSDYIEPDNASIAAIKAQTDKLTFDGSNNVYAVATVDVDEQAIADAVWDEAQSGHTTAGTFGAYLNAAITSRSSHSAADVWNVASRTVTGGTIDTLNDRTGFQLSAAGIDAIWDEPRSGHTTEGTFGYYLDAQVSSRATPAQAADAVWDEPRAGHTTDGTYGAVDEWASAGGATPQQIWEYATRVLTAPDNITSDNQKIDNSKIANLDAQVSTRLASTSYVVPDNAGITAIKATTDKIAFSGSGPYDVKATLDGEKVTVAANEDKSGYALIAAYDRAKDALKLSEYTEPDNTSIASIKAKTDKLTFDASNYVMAYSTNEMAAEDIADAVWDESRADHTEAGTFGAVSEWASVSTFGPDDIANAVWDEARAEHTETGTFGAVDEWARVYTGTQVVVQPLTAMPQSAVAAGGRIRAIADTTFACMIRVDATVLALTGAHFIYWNDRYPAVDIPPERVMLSEQEDGTTVVHVEAPAIYVQNPGEFTYYIYVPSSDRVFVEGKLTIAASKGV